MSASSMTRFLLKAQLDAKPIRLCGHCHTFHRATDGCHLASRASAS